MPESPLSPMPRADLPAVTPRPGAGPTAPFLPPPWPQKAQILAIWLPLVVLGLWAVSHLYVAPDSRACLALYRAARTIADTARVDATIPATSQPRTPEARSCGSIRGSARWF